MIRLCTPAIAGIVLFGSISVLPAESLPRKIAGLHEFVWHRCARRPPVRFCLAAAATLTERHEAESVVSASRP